MSSITRQMEVLARLLEKASPPPVLYRYRRPNEWTINEITRHEVHMPRPQDMNDPFEYRAPLSVDVDKLKAVALVYYTQQLGMEHKTARQEADKIDSKLAQYFLDELQTVSESSGIVCCSATPRSNRMWAYYADAHKGICIGYRTDKSPFCFAMPVIYENPDNPMEIMSAWANDVTMFCDHLARRKGKEWEFEQEYRIPTGEIPAGRGRTLLVPPESIQEIRLGVNIEPKFREELYCAIQELSHRPEVIQMGCDFNRFTLTETVIEPMS